MTREADLARTTRLGLDNLDDFAALILAAMRASAVGANFLVAVRAFGKLRDG